MKPITPAEPTKQGSMKPGLRPHEVVLGLITLLTLFVLLMRTAFSDGPAPIEWTKVIVRGAASCHIEYQEQTTLPLDHRALPLETHARIAWGLPVPDSWNEQVVETMMKLPKCHAMLKSLGPHAFVDGDGDGFMEVVDGWGRPMIYVCAVSHTDSFAADDFLRPHPHPYWVSAGADGLFGDARIPNDPALADNLYSDLLD